MASNTAEVAKQAGAADPDQVTSPYPVYVVAVASVVAGYLVTAGQVHPTQYGRWDVFLVGLVASVVIYVATESPWWMLALVSVLSGAAAVHTGQWTLVALSIVALAAGLANLRYWLPLVAGLSAALNLAVLVRLENGHFFGATSIVGITLSLMLLVSGMAYQTRACRRIVWIGLSVLGVLMIAGAVGFGVTAVRASDAISRGNDAARRGITSLKAGDFDTAATLFDRAGVAYADAQDQLSTPWSRAGRLVPVVAQNRTTAVRIIDSAAEVVGRAETAASQIDPDSLRVQNSKVDLAAVVALAGPVDQLQAAIGDLQATLDAPVSGWVPALLTDRVANVQDDVDRYRVSVDNLSMAVHAAPGLLGSERPRHYFVAFSTPAESRGIGGFVGNYAILTADDGTISMSDFGRSDDLRLAAPQDGMDIDLPQDFARRYGPFNFVGPNGKVEAMAWKNIGISPDFPTMTEVTAAMWEATYGTSIDGLILVDPYTVAQLLNYAGPQLVTGYDEPITSANAPEFILKRQYLVLKQSDRVDALAQLAQQTVQSLLSGTMPGPMQAARDLGPFVQEHRLMMYTTDPLEQRMFDSVGLAGAFPVTIDRADFGITFNNAGPNKMDAYLEHQVNAVQRFDPELGADVIDVALHLENNVKIEAAAVPYVGANSSGLPVGTVYDYLSVYSRFPLVSATRDGEPLAMSADQELGLVVASAYMDLAPAARTDIVVTFEAPGDAPPGGWRIFMAPTSHPPA